MDAREFLYWQDFYEHNPTKSEQSDWIIQQLATLITFTRNGQLDKKTKQYAVKLDDFLPPYLKQDKKASTIKKSREQQVKEAKAWAEANKKYLTRK